jgi:hypothetical protein
MRCNSTQTHQNWKPSRRSGASRRNIATPADAADGGCAGEGADGARARGPEAGAAVTTAGGEVACFKEADHALLNESQYAGG